MRLRGLYLAIVTLGLVFLGIHFGNTSWGRKIAGPPALGREFPGLDVRLWKEETPLINVEDDGHWLWFDVTDLQKRYLFLLVLTIAFTLVAKNLTRTRTGSGPAKRSGTATSPRKSWECPSSATR